MCSNVNEDVVLKFFSTLAVAHFPRHVIRNLTVSFVAEVQESFLQERSYSERCPITNSA